MVFRVANKHNDRTSLKRSFLLAAMSVDGIDQHELEVLKSWENEIA